MLPFADKVAFLLFACMTMAFGVRGFLRVYQRIRAGRADTDRRWNQPAKRVVYALKTTLLQSRTFRKRPWISCFHAFIFYGFVVYLLVNAVDAIDGFFPICVRCFGTAGNIYTLLSDVLSALVCVGVIALVIRRFFLPSRRDFVFNERTLVQPTVRRGKITRDSLIVSAFILFHVGSRAVGAAAKIRIEGPDRFAPFATLLSHAMARQHAEAWRIFGYWGALGSVLLFLSYFPYSKHLHLIAAPMNYLLARDVGSGVLPAMRFDSGAEEPPLGAAGMEAVMIGAATINDFTWPRLLDAFACIQCNRCQDVCPATATGKSLSPSALEINKRVELNRLMGEGCDSGHGAAVSPPLLTFALSPEAAWACTTCGACMQVCPVQDAPMLDIIDIRRQQVMMEGVFPAPLQSAFRGMERASNPWGTSQEKRLDWAAGLNVKTTDENPEPDVLFWVGCAASYDPQAQKTARAFVQLLQHAGVDFAVLGKRECCTGDSARRAGNEVLFRQLAETNVTTLTSVKPRLIVATCPHCMNAIGGEYKQFGGDFKVLHHTEYLASLIAEGKLETVAGSDAVSFHDPCYLGRHNGVYEAPRALLTSITTTVVELPRNRENSFCCGAGGAQFWKEEEPGTERISANRFREAQSALAGTNHPSLAVGCPFCKSMLSSTPENADDALPVRDLAEMLLEAVERKYGKNSAAGGAEDAAIVETVAPRVLPLRSIAPSDIAPSDIASGDVAPLNVAPLNVAPLNVAPLNVVESLPAVGATAAGPAIVSASGAAIVSASFSASVSASVSASAEEADEVQAQFAATPVSGDLIHTATPPPSVRKVWKPSVAAKPASSVPTLPENPHALAEAAEPTADTESSSASSDVVRPKWTPKAKLPKA